MLKAIVAILLLVPPDGRHCQEHHQDPTHERNAGSQTTPGTTSHEDIQAGAGPTSPNTTNNVLSLQLNTSAVINIKEVLREKSVTEGPVSATSTDQTSGSATSNLRNIEEDSGLETFTRGDSEDKSSLETSTEGSIEDTLVLAKATEENLEETSGAATSAGRNIEETLGSIASTRSNDKESSVSGTSARRNVEGTSVSGTSPRRNFWEISDSGGTDHSLQVNGTDKSSESCITWWAYGKRRFYPCRATPSPIEPDNDYLRGCIDEVRNKYYLSRANTLLNVLNLEPKGAGCGEPGAMYAEVCILIYNAMGIIVHYATHVRVNMDGPALVTLYRDIFSGIDDVDFSGKTGFLAVTISSVDECRVLSNRTNQMIITKEPSFIHYELILRHIDTYCAVYLNGRDLFMEYCVIASMNTWNGKMDSNCSFGSPYALIRGYPWASCTNETKLEGFCLIQSVEDSNGGKTRIYRTCANLVMESKNPELRSEKVEKCLAAHPSSAVGNQTRLMEIDIHDEDVDLMDLGCLIYGGFIQHTDSASYYNIIQISVISIQVFGVFPNAFAAYDLLLPEKRKQSANIYLTAITISNIMQALFMIVHYTLGYKGVFNKLVMCSFIHPFGTAINDLSLLITLALSVERYVAVCKPFLRASWCTTYRSVQILAVCIITSIAINSARGFIVSDVKVHFFYNGIEEEAHDLFSKFNSCFVDFSPWGTDSSTILLIVISSVTIFIPWCLIAVLNSIMAFTLHRQQEARAEMTSANTDVSSTAQKVIIRLLIVSWFLFFFPNLGFVLYDIVKRHIPNPYKGDVKNAIGVVATSCLVIKSTVTSTVYLGGQANILVRVRSAGSSIVNMVNRIRGLMTETQTI